MAIAWLLIAGASAFTPATSQLPSQLRTVRSDAVLRTSSPALVTRTAMTKVIASPSAAAARAARQPKMFLSIPKVLISIPTLYALMSMNEYATHRWYQHEEFNLDHAFQRFCMRVARLINGRPLWKKDGRKNLIKIKGGGHVEHHAETYDDMSLKKDPKWRKTKAAASLDADEFRGTAFTWQTTGIMTIQMLLGGTVPVFALLGFNLLEMVAVLLPGMLVHALVWNMLHPPMHGLPKVPTSIGAPSAWPFKLDDKLRNSFYFKWIYENHQGHHVLGGQGNYNVCCPGFDHVMGTYIPVSKWSKKMRAVPGPDATERWGLPVEPAGVPRAPIIAKKDVTEADLTPTALLREDGSLVHDLEGQGAAGVVVSTAAAATDAPMS